MEILIATNNLHKLQEIRHALAGTKVQALSLSDVGIDLDVEETGSTLHENALLKARAFAQASKMPTLADDTGFEVTALGGKPGIHAKRWVQGSDHDRNMHLLAQLAGKSDRTARFVTVLAFLEGPSMIEPLYFTGSVEGSIGMIEQGTAGFGYDPLFIPDGYTDSFAALGEQEKATLSHRSRAVSQFIRYILERIHTKEQHVVSA